jgi:hypothetical protein
LFIKLVKLKNRYKKTTVAAAAMRKRTPLGISNWEQNEKRERHCVTVTRRSRINDE